MEEDIKQVGSDAMGRLAEGGEIAAPSQSGVPNRLLRAARIGKFVGSRVGHWLGCAAHADWPALRHSVYADYLRFLKPKPRLDTPSNVKIDIVYVAHEKDIYPLGFSIRSLRKFLLHPIGKVAIIARDSPGFRQLCRECDCELVDEDGVAPIRKSAIGYVDRTGNDRSAWLLQQFLKLSGDTVANEEHYYTLDADTVLIRPLAMKRRGKTVLFCTEKEFHRPYYDSLRKLLRDDRRYPGSFVCHQMLFEKSKVKQMKSIFERHAGKPWHLAILDAVDKSESSCFCEWETYGNFLAANYPDEVDVQYFANTALPARELTRLAELERELSPRFQSISFHTYLS